MTKSQVLSALAHHIGARNGIHGDRLVVEILGAADPVGERRLRTIVTDLRLQGHHVCAHPETGYFIAETADELEQTCLFLYERAMASLKQIASMKRISMPDLRGQMHLPT